MKRLIACILLLVCLAPAALAERLDDEVLLSYYDNSVIFGDSITEAFRRYRSAVRQTDDSFLDGTTVICVSSISLYAASRRFLSGEFHFSYRGSEKTMYQITKEIKPERIFILLGLNDPVGIKIDKAVVWVEDIITHMPEFSPDTEIYFFSETPVTPGFCEWKGRPNYQEKINEYNVKLRETCEAHGAHYVEIAEALKGEDGYLNPVYSSDNRCHFSDEGVAVWIECMKDYAQEQYDLGLWDPFAAPEEPVASGEAQEGA